MERHKLLISGLIGSSISLMADICHAETLNEKVNVIFILADDLGYADLGCYGQKIIQTPNIDQMAREGMLFTQHYAGCTVSAPSRCSLMTGLHTGHTYIRGNKELPTEGQQPLPAESYTLAELFKDAGYATGCFGKWGLGMVGTDGSPVNQGFDHFYGYICQRQAHHYYPSHLWDNNNKVILEGNKAGGEKIYSQDLIHQRGLNFIREHAASPFFGYFSYVLPHAELKGPQDSIFQIYDGKFEEKPYQGAQPGKPGYGYSQQPRAEFAAMVTRLDQYVGEIIELLKELHLEQNTIVIFSSDNGPHREGGADPNFFKSNGQLKGTKRDMYEGGIRVPLITWSPDIIPADTKNDHISAFWDFMPTFAELTEQKQAITTDGISMLPTLLGKEGQKQHPYLYWEFHEGGGAIALRSGKWKGIKLNYGANPNGKWLLFDLSNDPHEDKDLSEKYPNIINRFNQLEKEVRTPSPLFNFGR